MRRLIGTSLVAACALAVPMLATSPAEASLAACGNINVEAKAQCELEASGGCEVNCTPVHFYAACSAEGYASCEGECDPPSVECSGSCEGSCEGRCENNPNFNCNVDCQAQCDGNCDAHCAASDDTAECRAHCQATCKGECDASCEGSPVTCEGQCKGSCEGQCKADTSMECQIDCQAELAVECYAEMEGGCKAACQAPEGALFCDGQYVDHGGNAQACIDAVKAWTAKIDAYASGSASAECVGNECTAEAEGEAGCSLSVANGRTDGSAPYAVGLFGVLGGLLFGRWRRRK